ncbi:hypothetical protein NN561_001414 [Cricetulus griseus]
MGAQSPASPRQSSPALRRQDLEMAILISLGKLGVFGLPPPIAGSSSSQETQDPAYSIPLWEKSQQTPVTLGLWLHMAFGVD